MGINLAIWITIRWFGFIADFRFLVDLDKTEPPHSLLKFVCIFTLYNFYQVKKISYFKPSKVLL